MKAWLSDFLTVNQTVWAGSLLQWGFYAAVLLVLLLEKRKMVRAVFGWYPLLFLLLLVSPLRQLALRLIGGGNAYFARLFFMLPIPFTFVDGFVLAIDQLAKRTENGALRTPAIPLSVSAFRAQFPDLLRLALTGILCVAIMYFGYSFYHVGWSYAVNLGKVPEEVYWLSDLLHRPDQETYLAVPSYLSSYLRQVDASFYTPYGRRMNKLGRELTSRTVDPQTAMTLAGQNAADFIVVWDDTPATAGRFAEAGWQPYAEHDGYLVYQVSGVPRIKKTHNEKRQLVLQTTLDELGNPTPGKKGYSSVAYAYDDQGNAVLISYLDEAGNPFTLSRGYAGLARTYTFFSGKVATETHLSAQGQPVVAAGYAEVRYEYGWRKKVVRESFFDEQGNPMLHTKKRYAVREIDRDAAGHAVEERFFGLDGRPVNNRSGVARIVRTYKGKKKVSELKYDAAGNRVN